MDTSEGQVILLDRLLSGGDLNNYLQHIEQFSALIYLRVDALSTYTIAIGSVRTALQATMKLSPTLKVIMTLSDYSANNFTLSLEAENKKNLSLQFPDKESLVKWHSALSNALAELIAADLLSIKPEKLTMKQIEAALDKLQGLVDCSNSHVIQVKALLKTRLSSGEGSVLNVLRSSHRKQKPSTAPAAAGTDSRGAGDENNAPLNSLSQPLSKPTRQPSESAGCEVMDSIDSELRVLSTSSDTTLTSHQNRPRLVSWTARCALLVLTVIALLLTIASKVNNGNIKDSNSSSSSRGAPTEDLVYNRLFVHENPTEGLSPLNFTTFNSEVAQVERQQQTVTTDIETVRKQYLEALRQFSLSTEAGSSSNEQSEEEFSAFPSIELVITVGRPPRLSVAVKQTKHKLHQRIVGLLRSVLRGFKSVGSSIVEVLVPRLEATELVNVALE